MECLSLRIVYLGSLQTLQERLWRLQREEVIEWINNHWREYINVDADGVVCFGLWKNDLKQAMKDE